MSSVAIGATIVDSFLDNKRSIENQNQIGSALQTPPRHEQTNNLRDSPIPSRFLDSLDDMSYSSDCKSSDEMEQGGGQKNKTRRKNSIIMFSNVKRKISATFTRSNSITNSPLPQRRHNKSTSPNRHGEKAESPQLPRRRKSSTPFQRFQSADGKRETKQRRSSASAVTRKKSVQKQSELETSTLKNLLLEKEEKHFQLRNKNLDALKINPSASTPDIQSRSRQNSFRAMKQFNIFLLGSKAVGKTALTVRFLTGRYIHEYRSTPEEVYTRVLKYDDEQVHVRIHVIDIESMETDIELDCDSGIMILYSVIDEKTYNDARLMLLYLSEAGIVSQYPVMFIGSKRDLSRMRKVNRKDAFNFSNKHNCTQFEVSAATDKRVKDSFHALFRQIEVRQLLAKSEESECKPAILNPPKISRNRTWRFGTA